MGLNAIAAVADEGANTVAAMRMDGAILASYDIAVNKAYTSVALKMPTEKLAELAAPGGELYGIQHTNGGNIRRRRTALLRRRGSGSYRRIGRHA